MIKLHCDLCDEVITELWPTSLHGSRERNSRRCSMTVYKMLTPKLRREITEEIDQMLDEVKTCKKNALTQMQFESLSALKTLIGQLPDG